MIRPDIARTAIDRAIQSSSFFFFVMKVFATLHPGEPMVSSWHIHAMCFALERLRAGAFNRLLFSIPPRHLKSICGSVAYPAWVLAHNPAAKIMVISYGQELAAEHSNNFRRIIEAEWYKRLFPQVEITKNTEMLIQTSAGGERRSSTLAGALTGLGADLVIIDDLMKAQDAGSAAEREKTHRFVTGALLPRLNNKRTGAILIVAQRLHEDDLPGHLLKTGRYEHLCLPAIAPEDALIQIREDKWHQRRQGEALCPERESEEDLEALRLEMGSRNFEAQYQQNPGASDSALIDWNKVRTYDVAPDRHQLEYVVQSWDTGFTANPKSDYSVGMTFGYLGGRWYLLDVVRGQWTYPDLKPRVLAAQVTWSADLLVIERHGSGIVLIDDLSEDRKRAASWGKALPFRTWGYTPRGPKDIRFAAHVDKIEAGRLVFPKSAPWLAELRRELLAFPEGTNDDQVDSLSQFLEWQKNSGTYVRLERREIVRRNPDRPQTIRRNIARR